MASLLDVDPSSLGERDHSASSVAAAAAFPDVAGAGRGAGAGPGVDPSSVDTLSPEVRSS